MIGINGAGLGTGWSDISTTTGGRSGKGGMGGREIGASERESVSAGTGVIDRTGGGGSNRTVAGGSAAAGCINGLD